jgi:hypothetical protein
MRMQIWSNVSPECGQVHAGDRRPWGFLERRRDARIRGVPYIAMMRQCKIVAPANPEAAANALILSPAG